MALKRRNTILPEPPTKKTKISQFLDDNEYDTYQPSTNNAYPNTVDFSQISDVKYTEPIKPAIQHKNKMYTDAKKQHESYNFQSWQTFIDDDVDDDVITTNDNAGESDIKIQTNKKNIKNIKNNITWDKIESTNGDIKLNEKFINYLMNSMKLNTPTPIQEVSIPAILNYDQDVLIQSETGSGKTLAYLIPVINDFISSKINRNDGCKCLIIGPTRELCLQINNVLSVLLQKYHFIIYGILIGGENRVKEKQRLRKGLTVVVGTPGRILDHLENTKSFKYNQLKYFIMDESDRLLDLGFFKFMKSIINIINNNGTGLDRLNILVSATLNNSESMNKLIKLSLNNYKFISLKDKQIINIPKGLKHFYINIRLSNKFICLIGLLRLLFNNDKSNKDFKVIVFMSTCNMIEYTYMLFKHVKNIFNNDDTNNSSGIIGNSKIKFFELRGNMDQQTRTKIFFEFCNIKYGILFCTDVCERGLDIPKVNYIIQYTPPTNLQNYIHRSGRTARIGNIGNTIIFLTHHEIKFMDLLRDKCDVKFIKYNQFKIFNKLDKDYEFHLKGYKKHKKLLKNMDDINVKHIIFENIKKIVDSNDALKSKSKDAISSFISSYAAYPRNLKSIFYVKNLDFSQLSYSFFIEKNNIKNNHNKYKKPNNNHKITKEKRIFSQTIHNEFTAI